MNILSTYTSFQSQTCLNDYEHEQRNMNYRYSKTKSMFSRSKLVYILGLTQLATVLFLLATMTGTCQRTSTSNLKIKPKYADLITKPKIRLPPKFKSILSHLWLSDLILRSGDVYPISGPRRAGPPIFPCGSCQRPVKNLYKAINCDECNLWHQINCVGISTSTYHSPPSLIKLLSGSANTAASQTLHPHNPVTNSLYHILIVMNTTMQSLLTTTTKNPLSGQTPKMHLPLNVKRKPRENHLNLFYSTPTASKASKKQHN